MTIEFEKTLVFSSEVNDDDFKDGLGNISENKIMEFCESVCESSDDTWVSYDKVKNIFWEDSDEKRHRITESEYDEFCDERERAEHCYECGGYGDDYDSDGNCVCESCPFNSNENDDKKEVSLRIDPQEFTRKLCNKIVAYYGKFTDYNSSVEEAKNLLNETKFSYIEIYSKSRIFLFAENPMAFIKDNRMWNYLQDWVNDEYNGLMAIGLWRINNLENSEEVYAIQNISDYLE